mgnify:CR=1 FL=1
MRKGWMLFMCGCVGMLALTVLASEKPPSDFAAAMQAIAGAQAAAAKATAATFTCRRSFNRRAQALLASVFLSTTRR